jgi:hypothetical protein
VSNFARFALYSRVGHIFFRIIDVTGRRGTILGIAMGTGSACGVGPAGAGAGAGADARRSRTRSTAELHVAIQ